MHAAEDKGRGVVSTEGIGIGVDATGAVAINRAGGNAVAGPEVAKKVWDQGLVVFVFLIVQVVHRASHVGARRLSDHLPEPSTIYPILTTLINSRSPTTHILSE